MLQTWEEHGIFPHHLVPSSRVDNFYEGAVECPQQLQSGMASTCLLMTDPLGELGAVMLPTFPLFINGTSCINRTPHINSMVGSSHL